MGLYFIKKADDQEQGPVSEEDIRQLIAEKRIFARTLIRSENSNEWRELSEMMDQGEFIPSSQMDAAKTSSVEESPVPCRPCASTAPKDLDDAWAKWSHALGITSLVMGLCCIGFLFTIPAIIAGHIALHKSRRYPTRYGGERKAKTGLACGYAGLALFIFAVTIAFPKFKEARLMASAPLCLEHLQDIGAANLAWARAHDNGYAPNFLCLSNQLLNPICLVCPSLRDYPSWNERSDWSQLDTTWFSYEYPGAGQPTNTPPSAIMIRCPRHGHICYMDGHVAAGPKYQSRCASILQKTTP